MENIEEFEQLFQAEANSAATPPPAGGWEAISGGLSSGATTGGGIASSFNAVSTLIKAALFIGGTAVVIGITYKANSPSAQNNQTPTSQESQVAQPTDESSTEQYIEPQNPSKTPVDQEGRTVQRDQTSSKSAKDNAIEDATNTSQYPQNSEPSDGVDNISPIDKGGQQEHKADGGNAGSRSEMLIDFSNYRPCKGETIALSNNKMLSGDWFVNNKKIAGNTNKTNYKCSDGKRITVVFKSETHNVSKTLIVSELEAKLIVNDKADGDYNFQLSDQSLISNWYINDELIATNAKYLNHTFNEVGKHSIKASPVNHACSEELKTSIRIEPKGSIETVNIFTPNGDGKNDEYKVSIKNYTNFYIQIFTTRLEKVFESSDPEEAWNGKIYNAEHPCADGEYIARISYQLEGEKPAEKTVRIKLSRSANN